MLLVGADRDSLELIKGRGLKAARTEAVLKTIERSSSKDPQRVEKKVFEVIDKMKSDIDVKELARLQNRIALKRCKEANDREALLDRLVARTLDGTSLDDLAVETVTREEMLAAARKYMPSHRQAYVRLALQGQ